jgi:hypothetical protein
MGLDTRAAVGPAAGVDSRASRRSGQRNASPAFYPLLALGDFSRQQKNYWKDTNARAVGGSSYFVRLLRFFRIRWRRR